MSYHQVPQYLYEEILRKAAPHAPQEPCDCNGSCKSEYCTGYIKGCDCDIDYTELKRLQNTEPLMIWPPR